MFQAKGKQAEMGKAFNCLRTSKEFSVAGSRPARGRDVGEEGKDYSGPKTKTGNLDFIHFLLHLPTAASASSAEEADVEWFYEDLQDLLN